jgi:hypothetical protein
MSFSEHLQHMPNNSILYQCYLENRTFDSNNSWMCNLKRVITSTDLNNLTKSKQNESHNQLLESFKVFWLDQVNKESSKLRHYASFKDRFMRENYLDVLWHFPYRSKLSSLRLSCHKLHIETGRYVSKNERLPPLLRICSHCNMNKCESEYHFIIECPLYNNERNILLYKLKNIYNFIENYKDEKLYIYGSCVISVMMLSLH